MTTPNNAAALECVLDEMGAFIEQEESPNLDTLENWHQRLRATLAQPDTLTSQPSGEAVSIPVVQQTAPERIWLAVADDAYYADKPFPDGEEVCWSSDAPLQVCVPYVRVDLATHPSADAPWEAMPSVSDSMVRRFRHAYENMPICATEDDHVRAALTAALAPKPEGWEPCSPELPRIPYPKPEGGQ